MEKIHTLTVNSQTYTLEDPTAARIDNSVVGGDAWSGRQIIDSFCPAFSEKGATVTCKPVQGYPLGVISYIEPAQQGEGDPSPEVWKDTSGMITYPIDDRAYAAQLTIGETYQVTAHSNTELTGITVEIVENGEAVSGAFDGNTFRFTMPLSAPSSDGNSSEVHIYAYAEEEMFSASFTLQQLITPGNIRPIRGFDAVRLNHGNGENTTVVSVALGQTVYGGSYNWETGILTVAYRLLSVNEKNSLKATNQYDHDASTNRYILIGTDTGVMVPDNASGACDQLQLVKDTIWANDNHINAFTINGGNQLHMNLSNDLIGVTAEDDAATRTAAFKVFLKENPLTFVLPVKNTTTIQLDPAQILALSGQNTLTSDTGDTEVWGRLDMIPLLQSLMGQV